MAKKARLLDVVYNASNNELVRTKTLVKNTIVQIDAHPFRAWYTTKYGVDLGLRKGKKAESAKEAEKPKSQSRHVKRKIEQRQKDRKIDSKLED